MGNTCGSRVLEQNWAAEVKNGRFEGLRRTGGRKKIDRRANLRAWVLKSVFVSTRVCTAVAVRIIYVDDDGPADFNSIQAAINDSNDGDTVIVADGTYTGPGNRDIDFLGKAITVRSENGPEHPNLDYG